MAWKREKSKNMACINMVACLESTFPLVSALWFIFKHQKLHRQIFGQVSVNLNHLCSFFFFFLDYFGVKTKDPA